MGSITIEAGVREGWCRGCGARIWWAVTSPGGKKMPFSRKPVILSDRDAPTHVVSDADVHWATCPKAKDFRKRDR